MKRDELERLVDASSAAAWQGVITATNKDLSREAAAAMAGPIAAVILQQALEGTSSIGIKEALGMK